MRRAVLISPPSWVQDNPVPPLGLLAIASYADAHVEGVRCEILDLGRLETDEALRRLDAFQWDDVMLVGLTVMSMDVPTACEIAARARALAPESVVIAGGAHPTLAWREFLAQHTPPFDACMVGEGEAGFAEILTALRDDREFDDVPGVAVPTPNGPRLAAPARLISPAEWTNPFQAGLVEQPDELMYFVEPGGRRRRGVSLTTSRSCPLACTFCSIVAVDEPYRSASPEDVVDWLSWEMGRRPFEHIYFLDADFLTSRSRARKFSEAIHRAFPTVTWSVQATVGHVLSLRQDLDELRERGLRAVELGIEAGDDEQLLFFNKRNFGKPATVQQSIDAVALLVGHHMMVGIDYIMFYPDQTMAGLARNVAFFVRSGLIDAFDVSHYGHELILFPGTPLRSLYEGRCQRRFETDTLPDTNMLFVDQDVLKVKSEFTGGYLNRHGVRARTVREELRAAARQTSSDRRRAVLRLHEMRLRHHPYVVLSALVRTRGDGSAVYRDVEADLRAAESVLLEQSVVTDPPW